MCRDQSHRTIRGCAAIATFLVGAACVIPLATGADEPAKNAKTPAKTNPVKAGEITLNVPESWTAKKGGGMRLAEFEVPPQGDDKESGEFVVFYFGQQGAGGVQANIDRWVGQFDEDSRKVRTITGESPLGKYTLVDLAGTYKKTIGPPVQGKSKRLPGWRVLNAIIETKSGPYFLKLDGPEKMIAAIENDFRATFGAKKDGEKERQND